MNKQALARYYAVSTSNLNTCTPYCASRIFASRGVTMS